MKRILLIVAIAISSEVLAGSGYIATSVEVDEVTNTASNGKSFSIKVSGGDGSHPCEDTVITFPLSKAGNSGNDTDIHTRAFSLAITALTAGKKISVVNYEDDTSCNGAAYIKLLK